MGDHELTAGLEVHQQLDTGKLFCACPSEVRDDAPDFVVGRVLRATAGEDGETDVAAAAESRKGKRYVYQGYADTTCLVELDEEPVSALNPAALQVALQVAKLLGVTVMDEVHVMRKTVVDGSNTAGFQRTALVGLDGSIEVSGSTIRIEQLCLEEDSAKIVERADSQDVYNLSRLGIALLEITTGPDLHSPQQVKDVAGHIGMLLRSTERVKRGLGTIRQDVNVSVPGGARVEIKGAQDLDILATLVENEAARQRSLINLSQAIPKQSYGLADVTAAFSNTQRGFVSQAINRGGKAIAVKLAGWKQALAAEVQPGVRLGKELAGYAKAAGFGGLIHSAEDASKYGFAQEPQQVRDLLACGPDDAWLLMVGEEQKLALFITHTLIARLEMLSVGVPSEVRKAEADGTTSYLRPMPGAARMYPETDVRPVTPDLSNVALPELWPQKISRFVEQYAISEDLARQIVREGLGRTFEVWATKYGAVSPSVIATLLASKEREIRTRHGVEVDITRHGPAVLERLAAGAISPSSVEEILVVLGKGEPVDWHAYKPVDDAEVRRVVGQLVAENPGASVGMLMGKVMRHFENKVDGKLVNQLVAEALGK